jgi:hypothetical protein
VGLDPEESLAQRDEGSDVLNPVRVQVLQLDAVVVQWRPWRFRSVMALRRSPSLLFFASTGPHPYDSCGSSIKRPVKTARGRRCHSLGRTIPCATLCWTSTGRWPCTRMLSGLRGECSHIQSASAGPPLSFPSSAGKQRRNTSTIQSGARPPGIPRIAR